MARLLSAIFIQFLNKPAFINITKPIHMIILANYTDIIIDFVNQSTEAFRLQNGDFNSVGIYCCPWSGWISINFNINQSIGDTENSCPDFEFVEFDILEVDEWQQEYESETPAFTIGNDVVELEAFPANEVWNEIFFKFLLPIVVEISENNKKPMLLQMLDSEFHEVI
jgi:hypothetical protein